MNGNCSVQCESRGDALRTLAGIVELNTERVLAAWEQEAAAVLQDELLQTSDVAVEQLRAECAKVLKYLPSRLRSRAFADLQWEKEHSYVLGEERQAHVNGDLSPALKYRLYALFTKVVWKEVIEQAPASWSAEVANQLEQDLKAGMETLLGTILWEYVVGLEKQLKEARGEHSEAYAQMLSRHEQERKRIAHEMHDVLAQALAGARYRADTARRLLPKDVDQATAEIMETQQLIEYALSHVRKIIVDLRPVALA